MYRLPWFAWFAAAAWILLTGCGRVPTEGNSATADDAKSDTNTLTKVSLMLNWYPEAEHGGYYAALVHGYFEEAGLDVKIIPGGPNAPVVQQAARGAVDFGVTNADRIVLARAQDAKIKALLAPLANSPRCLLVHADSGIEKFEQLQNVTMMLSREHAWAQFLIKKLPLDGVKIVPNSASLAPFLADPRAAKQGYIISEPFVAKKAGADVRSLLVADFGFNPYTSVLMTSDQTIEQRPQLVRKVIDASRRGWEKYLADPTETNRRIHELNPEMGLEILDFGVRAMKEHCIEPDAATDSFGRMTSERWHLLVSQLEELAMLDPGAVDAAALYLAE
ncbi:MAG TPA: ABC transporter substrate-binding protein [Pirellulaceae bacterium]|nr:ABC transporter substrate-binding protein [Pirellulaceae bacterium]